MSGNHDVLDRLAPLFLAPERPFEGFERRRDRMRRNQRIGTTALALLMAAAALGGAFAIFRRAESTRPASTGITPDNVADLRLAWSGDVQGKTLSPPVVVDGIVYVTGDDVVAAFRENCGSGGSTCKPLWTGDGGNNTGDPPVVADGMVLVGIGRSYVTAYDVGCGTGGVTCRAVWSAGPFHNVAGMVASHGVLYLTTAPFGGQLWAIDMSTGGILASGPGCEKGNDQCSATSPLQSSGNVFSIQDGTLFAFPAGCGLQVQPCDPLWSWTPADGSLGGVIAGPRLVAATVFVHRSPSSPRRTDTLVLSSTCGSDGASCSPLWTARGVGGPPGAIANDRLYVLDDHGKSVEVFSTSCATDGSTCSPLFRLQFDSAGIRPFLAVAPDGAVIYAGNVHELDAFPATCASETCRPLWRGGTVGFAPEIVTSDGLVFESEPGIKAYPERCAIGGAECTPVWTSTETATSPPSIDGRYLLYTSGQKLLALTPGGGGGTAPGERNGGGGLQSVVGLAAVLAVALAIAIRRRTRVAA